MKNIKDFCDMFTLILLIVVDSLFMRKIVCLFIMKLFVQNIIHFEMFFFAKIVKKFFAKHMIICIRYVYV